MGSCPTCLQLPLRQDISRVEPFKKMCKIPEAFVKQGDYGSLIPEYGVWFCFSASSQDAAFPRTTL